MKTKLIYLISAMILIFNYACEEPEKNEKAKACFTFLPDTSLIALTPIKFSNCSENATYFIWSFGDGNISTEKEPSHLFDSTGSYTVKLVASNDNFADSVSQILSVTMQAVEDTADTSNNNLNDFLNLLKSKRWRITKYSDDIFGDYINNKICWAYNSITGGDCVIEYCDVEYTWKSYYANFDSNVMHGEYSYDTTTVDTIYDCNAHYITELGITNINNNYTYNETQGVLSVNFGAIGGINYSQFVNLDYKVSSYDSDRISLVGKGTVEGDSFERLIDLE